MDSPVTLTRSTRFLAAAAIGALTLGLAACGSSDDTSSTPASTTSDTASTGTDLADLTATLAGAGSSAQSKAVEAWIAGVNAQAPNVSITYDPSGSGAGREQIAAGAVDFAGSDAYLTADETSATAATCTTDVLELPLYISPIAVVYNVPGLSTEHLQLDAATIAKIFDGKITKWNDPAIAALNDGVDLPDLAIVTVHRSDNSGTTTNFTEYLNKASDGAWSYDPSGDWPIQGGQSGEGTQGLIDVVNGAEGAIGYADASRAGDLGTVAVKVGDAFNAPTAEGAAKTFDVSPAASTASDTQLTVDPDRTTTEAGAYPVILVSYVIACQGQPDADKAAALKAYLTYAASAEGQTAAADPSVAGSAPISDELRTKVDAAIATITTR